MGRTTEGRTTTPIARTMQFPGWTGILISVRQNLLEFTKFAIQLSQQHPVLQRKHFFQGRKIRGSEVKDLTWFRPDGNEMTDEDWENPENRCLGLRLAGDAIDETDENGDPITDDTLMVLPNANDETVQFDYAGSGTTVDSCPGYAGGYGKKRGHAKKGGRSIRSGGAFHGYSLLRTMSLKRV